MTRQKISAVICAAGKGERAGFDKNKLLVPLNGAPALYHTLKKFYIPEIDEVIIASSKLDYEEISALAAPFGFKVVIGGATRTQSVKRALDEVSGEIVLIHDGARPYVTSELINKCIDSVKKFKSGVCAVKATDTAVLANGGIITDRIDRNSLFLVQTPQAFYTEDIKKAYILAGEKVYTDDSAVYGEFIGAPHLVEGNTENVKLTFKEHFMKDYPPVTSLTCSAPIERVGFGVDVHAFGEGDCVTLAGVKIACDRGLVAHSDGDVVVHAVMDAILSASGLKDIGHYFPDSGDKFKGADSLLLLKEVVSLAASKGFTTVNISVSVQAEKPRLAPHIDKMIENLSAYTGVAAENIAVAAGTCEKLGFVGEALGIAAYCTVLLRGKNA